MAPLERISPFERLNRLLAGIEPGAAPIDLTVGGPRHPMPAFVEDVIRANLAGFNRYPAIQGTDPFRDAVHGWLDQRFALGGLLRAQGEVLALNGSREGLFFAAIAARAVLDKPGRPAVLFANPFYQAYSAAAAALGAEAVPLVPLPGQVMPDWSAIPADTLRRAVCVFVASPSNPQGRTASLADWARLLALADEHDFYVFADECYSEIYRERAGPPPGALQAARQRGSLARLAVFNSLSKRSNLPGLRCGFVAGDRTFLRFLREMRNEAAPQVPAPLQAVAAAALGDELHVAENRRLYDLKFRAAAESLPSLAADLVPPAGFFLWLDVGGEGDDVAFARRLWAQQGVRAVPGSYLALTGPDQHNPGSGFLRIALVAEIETTRTALARISEAMAAA